MTINAGEPYQVGRPCRFCGYEGPGVLRPSNGQNCVYCGQCGRHSYNAPKSETGEEQRSVRTRPEIKPSLKAKILERDGGRCAVCGTEDGILHVGHFLSVVDGRELGLTDAELWSEENLAAMCEECNLGFNRVTLSLKLIAKILHVRVHRADQRPGAA